MKALRWQMLAFLVVGLASPMPAETYYVYDGSTVKDRPTQSFNTIFEPTVIYWEVWLFPRGAATTNPNGRWGTITGRSPQEVMNELKKAQEGEQYNIEHYGRDVMPNETYTNPLGPVAVVPRKTPSILPGSPSLTDQIIEQMVRSSDVLKILAADQGIISKRTEELKLQGNPGDVLSEYGRELADAVRRVHGLQKVLEQDMLADTGQLEADATALTAAVDDVNAIDSRLHAALGPPSDTTSSGSSTPPDGPFAGFDTSTPSATDGTFADPDTWGKWTPFNRHPGILYRLRYTTSDPDFPLLGWWIQFRNNSGQSQQFSFEVVKPDDKPGATMDQNITLAPGEVQTEGLKGFMPDQRPPKKVRVNASFPIPG